jgi:hypothetical protein
LPGRPALVVLDILLRNIALYLLNPNFLESVARVVFSGQLKRYFASPNTIWNAESESAETDDTTLAFHGSGLLGILAAVAKKQPLGTAHALRGAKQK